jgi:hypothetical protein
MVKPSEHVVYHTIVISDLHVVLGGLCRRRFTQYHDQMGLYLIYQIIFL